MRKIAVIVAAALVFAACSSSSDTGSGDTDTAAQAAQAVTGGSDFCKDVTAMIAEFDAMDEANADAGNDEMPDFEAMFTELYETIITSFKRLERSAPAELKGDFQTVIDMAEKSLAMIKDPDAAAQGAISEEESAAADAANERIGNYIEQECGISLIDETAFAGEAAGSADDDIVVGTDKDPVSSPVGEATATQTVTIAGVTYTEELSGPMEVSCDMYGDLETGSIGVYLTGEDFESSVSSYDTGIMPGSYEGLVWVFATDPDLDESTWGLQEIDGLFFLDRSEQVGGDMWLFEGSYSAVDPEDPSTAIEASFSCVGPVGF